MNKKTFILNFAIVFFSLALVVVALAPSTPTTLSPNNNSYLFNTPYLQALGATDPEGNPINITFFGPGYRNPEFYQGGCQNDWYCNSNATYDEGGAAGLALSTGGAEAVGNWQDVLLASAQSYICELKNDNTNYYTNGSATSWTGANTSCSNLNGSEYGWNLVTIDTIEEQGTVATLCDALANNYCYTSGYSTIGAGGVYFWSIPKSLLQINVTLQNSSATAFNWTALAPRDNVTWFAQACDNNSECSNITEVRTFNFFNLTSCAVSSNTLAVNYSIIDELTGNSIAANSINNIALSSSADAKNYPFTETATNSFGYCLNPIDFGITSNQNLSLTATGYQQRSYSLSDTLTGGSPTMHILYLLNTSDGIFVTFQVVDSANAQIAGASITAKTVINSQLVTVATGMTDGAGTITFFLDPLKTHTIMVSATGYSSLSTSITPTQSSYTIVLGGATADYSNSIQGIKYDTLPKDLILNNNTGYNFTFNISSSYWNLTSYGLVLKNSTGGILNSSTDNTATGGTLTIQMDTDNLTEVNMEYFWNVNGNYTNFTKSWQVTSNYQGELSIKTFFDDLKNFTAAGFGAFILAIIAIVIIVGVIAWLAYDVGLYNPLGLATVVMLLVWGLEYLGIIPPLQDRAYLLSTFVTLIWVGFLIQEYSR